MTEIQLKLMSGKTLSLQLSIVIKQFIYAASLSKLPMVEVEESTVRLCTSPDPCPRGERQRVRFLNSEPKAQSFGHPTGVKENY